MFDVCKIKKLLLDTKNLQNACKKLKKAMGKYISHWKTSRQNIIFMLGRENQKTETPNHFYVLI